MAEELTAPVTAMRALELVRYGKPEEVSADEVSAVRARFEASPALYAAAGGRDVVDRFLAAAEAAAATRTSPSYDQGAATESTPTPRPRSTRRIRRSIELFIYGVIVAGAAYWVYSLLPSITWRSETAETAAGDDAQDKNAAGHGQKTATGREQRVAPASNAAGAAAAEIIENPSQWDGWRISPSSGSRSEVRTEWDLSDPARPRPAQALVLHGGPVQIVRTQTIKPTDRWLLLNAQPRSPAPRAGAIRVLVDGKEIFQAAMGIVGTTWPAHVPLEKSSGKDRRLEVHFLPGDPDQEIAIWSMETISRRSVIRRINCGGAAVRASDGDWEGELQGSPALVSRGTGISTTTAPVARAGRLEPVYQSERWAYQDIEYTFELEPGRYEVVLHFAETNNSFQAVGKRLFDIQINGKTLAAKVDVFAKAGPNTAWAFTAPVDLPDGKLNVTLRAVRGGPAIKALEIRVPE